MTVYIFGKINLPCIANWVIKRKASDQFKEHPVDIINTIHANFYMDYYLHCFSSEEKTIDTIQKGICILSNNDFRLTKWLSNNSYAPHKRCSQKRCINKDKITDFY